MFGEWPVGRAAHRIRHDLADHLTVAPASMTQLGADSGELTVHGIDRGWAVRLLLNALDVPITASIAVGDETNDIPMFRTDAVSIAMTDALPQVLTAATHITLSPENSGIAYAFARLGL